MGNAAAGIQQKAWAKIEAAFNVPEVIAAGDAFDFNTIELSSSRNFLPHMSHIGTASLQGEVAGKIENSFSIDVDVMPNGAGVAPDVAALLQSAFGQAPTIVASTSVTYAFSDDDDIPTLQIVRQTGPNLCEWAYGAAVETMTLVFEAGEIVRITFEGRYARYGFLAGDVANNGTPTASATTIDVNPGTAGRIGKWARIAFGAEDNSGAGYLVTDVDVANDTITISPGLASGIGTQQAITPVLPSHSVSGSRIGGVEHNLQIDSVALGFQSGQVAVNTGNLAIENEADQESISGWYRGRREVTPSFEFYYLNENAILPGGRHEDISRDVALRLGPDIAARRCKVNLPNARLTVEQLDVPDAEIATYSAEGMARQSAAAGDELELVFD